MRERLERLVFIAFSKTIGLLVACDTWFFVIVHVRYATISYQLNAYEKIIIFA